MPRTPKEKHTGTTENRGLTGTSFLNCQEVNEIANGESTGKIEKESANSLISSFT